MKRDILYVTIMIVLLMGLGVASFVKNFNSDNVDFTENLELGNKAYDKEIYIDAIDYYSKASNSKPSDVDVRLKLADAYLKLGNTSKYESVLKDTINSNSNSEKGYLKLAKYYANNGKYENAYTVLLSADVENDKEIKKLLDKYKSYYRAVGSTFDDLTQWHDGYLAIKRGEGWGLIDTKSETVVDAVYQNIGSYSDEEKVTPVTSGDQNYYINEDGYRKLVGDKNYEYLGAFGNGYAPACLDGKYGWVNRDFEEFMIEYDYTTPFINGVAAVKKDQKWALIDDDLEMITKFKYDDIVLDKNGFCANGKVIFVKEKDHYYLVDNNGDNVKKLKFEDVKPFYCDQYAAVKKDGKWGYINSEGELVIKYKYDNAYSFSNGVAGVMKNGAWGLITQDNEEVIEPMFSDIGSMNDLGIIPVKTDTTWQCIQIYSLMKYES